MADRGAPAGAVNMLLNAWQAASGHPAFLTSTIADIVGRPARTFQQWASDHAEEFQSLSQEGGGA